MPFLPITREEMKERGIEQFDFVYVIGDAYVDHPSFGHAIISRLLEAHQPCARGERLFRRHHLTAGLEGREQHFDFR